MVPLVVTIFPTRKCNLNCSYCKIRCQDFSNELNWMQWIGCLEKINERIDSICFNVLLGGDITMWGDDLVRFVKGMNETSIPYGFTTNGVLLDEAWLIELRKSGLDSVSLSLDTLEAQTSFCEDTKSSTTRKLLPLLNKLGFKDLHCTITVDNRNLMNLTDMIKFLTSQKTYSEITPMLFGKNKEYDYASSYDCLKDRLFTEEDKRSIDKVMNEIVIMKSEGYLIHNTDSFLLNWTSFGIEQQWKCDYPVGLVADADGSMRLCLHIKGDKVTQHFIKNLDFEKFLKDWYNDYDRLCCGCYWNCVYEAKYVYEKTGDIKSVDQYFNHGVKGLGL